LGHSAGMSAEVSLEVTVTDAGRAHTFDEPP
jgi:hypothetical protein